MTSTGRFERSYQLPEGAPVASFPSRVNRVRLRASHRADLFHDICTSEWLPVWDSREDGERYVASGRRLRRPYDLSLTKKQALGELWACRQGAPRFVRLRILGAIYHWRTLTTQQIASIVGATGIAGDLMVLWQAGLVWRGEAAPRRLGAETPDLELWRIAPDAATVRKALQKLSVWERYGVMAGTDLHLRGVTPVHDLVMADLSLRVAELVPEISAVYGEELSRAKIMTKLPDNVTRGARGDGVWVRSDGMRIVIELAMARDESFNEKAERWARVLASTNGIFVLFVVGTHRDHKSHSLGWTINKYREAVATAAWSDMSYIAARVPERMGVVSLAEWAPAPMELTPGFEHLPVWRPTGAADDRFERADLADRYQVVYEPRPGSGTSPAIYWGPLVYAMPWWLADEAMSVAHANLRPGWRVALPKRSRK